jgi:outer membrane autotransporter protein
VLYIHKVGGGVSPISINSEIVSIHDADYPVCANGGSIVINSTEAYINSAYGTHDDVAINQWSVYSMNGGSVIFNETGNHRLNTAGYMNADGGSIALRAGADSIMQHRAVIEGNGTFNMTLLDRAVWHMPHNNTLTNLAFEDGGSVDFDHDYNFTQDTPNFKNLTTTTLSGKGGTLGMRIDMAKDADTVLANDQIIVSGAATGEHKVAIDFVNGLSSIPEGKTHSANWLISQGEGSNLTLTNKDGGNTFSGRGMVTVWSLGFVGENEKDKLDTDEGRAEVAENTTGSGQGNWYLIKHDVALPNPDPDPENPNPAPDPEPELPPEVADNLLLGTSAAQAMSFSKDDKTLRHRMGEVRYGTQDGSWVRVDAQKDRFETGFKQKTYGLMVGYDSLTERKKGSVWLLGGAFRYANSDQEALATRQVDGELEQYSVKMYGTWIHDKGSYADIVLQAGRFDQEVNGLDNVGTGTAKADYTTYGFGASVEVGHTFKFSQNAQTNDHWFVEPQFQLSYFYAKGKDYTTSTGLRVEQGNADFLTGRAGAVFGKKFNLGSITDPRYFQLAFTGGLNHEFMGDQNIRYIGVDGASQTLKAHGIDGTRLYYGLTADWQCTDMLRAYAYFEREEGDGYTQDYDINIGLKYLF